ncbi:MAG: phosphoribosyltransferase [Candidatus Levybacteria bacterium CG10_big_fil_rev_8_21_14_0_10_35_13]|nr:MAG: phosphoribosyltransferase [Candidatus Levybacteria bacterium CG10_big_fil_rev_8_21_14_0_10_35_13]
MFEDRVDAANKLCRKLIKFSDNKNTFVVGLTRGGVVTAKIISQNLRLKLKAIIVKKIGLPWSKELAIGAIISNEDVFWNDELCKEFDIDKNKKKELIKEKEKELKDLNNILRLKPEDYSGKTIILVDDGVATGMTVLTALKYLRKKGAFKIILAIPVIALDTLNNISKYFDNVVYLEVKKDFFSVSQFYKNFEQISDQKVAKILKS